MISRSLRSAEVASLSAWLSRTTDGAAVRAVVVELIDAGFSDDAIFQLVRNRDRCGG